MARNEFFGDDQMLKYEPTECSEDWIDPEQDCDILNGYRWVQVCEEDNDNDSVDFSMNPTGMYFDEQEEDHLDSPVQVANKHIHRNDTSKPNDITIVKQLQVIPEVNRIKNTYNSQNSLPANNTAFQSKFQIFPLGQNKTMETEKDTFKPNMIINQSKTQHKKNNRRKYDYNKKVSSKIHLDTYKCKESDNQTDASEEMQIVEVDENLDDPDTEGTIQMQVLVNNTYISDTSLKRKVGARNTVLGKPKAPSRAVVVISTDKSKNSTQIVINTLQGEQVFQGKTSDLLDATGHDDSAANSNFTKESIGKWRGEKVHNDANIHTIMEIPNNSYVREEIVTDTILEHDGTVTKDPAIPNCDMTQAENDSIMKALFLVGVSEDQMFSIKSRSGISVWLCVERDCGFTFPTLVLLKRHMLQHYGLKPFKCDVENCKWSFYTSFKLKRHKESHNKSKKYMCTEEGCDRKFTTPHNLQNHIKRHQRPATIQCPVDGCIEKFQTKRKQEDHAKNKHKGDSTFKCPVESCSKVYYSFALMSSHSRSHLHSEDELRCNWEGCGKVFDQPCRLREHRRQHTGDKPYKCLFEGCTWSFLSSSKLRRHYQKHKPDKKFPCEYPGCDKCFKRKEHLRDHITSHEDRAFKCPIESCNLSFRTRCSLYNHRKRHHSTPVQKRRKRTKEETKSKTENVEANELTDGASVISTENVKQKTDIMENLLNSERDIDCNEVVYVCPVETCNRMSNNQLYIAEHILREHAFSAGDFSHFVTPVPGVQSIDGKMSIHISGVLDEDQLSHKMPERDANFVDVNCDSTDIVNINDLNEKLDEGKHTLDKQADFEDDLLNPEGYEIDYLIDDQSIGEASFLQNAESDIYHDDNCVSGEFLKNNVYIIPDNDDGENIETLSPDELQNECLNNLLLNDVVTSEETVMNESSDDQDIGTVDMAIIDKRKGCARTFMTYQQFYKTRETLNQITSASTASSDSPPNTEMNFAIVNHDFSVYHDIHEDSLEEVQTVEINGTNSPSCDMNMDTYSLLDRKTEMSSNPMMAYGLIDTLGETLLVHSPNSEVTLDGELLSGDDERITIGSLLMQDELTGTCLYDQDATSHFPVLLMDSESHHGDYPSPSIHLGDLE